MSKNEVLENKTIFPLSINDRKKYMSLIEEIQTHIKNFTSFTLSIDDLEKIVEYSKFPIPFRKKKALDGDLEYAFAYLYIKNQLNTKGEKYPDIYSFYNSYPELSSTTEDLDVLRKFANTVDIMTKLKVNFTMINKQMYLKLGSKISENWNANYTTGGGQTLPTTIRTNIISKETGIYPKKLKTPRNRKPRLNKAERESLKFSLVKKELNTQKKFELEFYNHVDMLIEQNDFFLNENHECSLDFLNTDDVHLSDIDFSSLFD